MFDLNIDIFPRNPACRGARTPSEEASGTFQATELSGVSNSSGFNFAGGGDRDSHNSVSALKFDIFSKLRTPPDVVPDNDDEEDGDQVVTWQLFPANGDGDGGGGGGEGVGGLSCDSEFRVGPSETQWLNLSVSGSGSGSSALERSTMTVPPQQQQARRSRRGPRSRSSQYRGVTFYRRTGRWESHIWDCGKQVYLGGFDTAFAAARAYDRAAIKFRGVDADINFGVTDYQEDMKQMKHLNKEEFVQALRRQSTGVSRGSSRYRGTTLPRCDQWEAPMGQYLGKKAYDKAAIQFSGRETVANFERSNYEMKMPLEVNRELAHNLDLNLGISVSVEQPQGNKNAREVYPLPPLYHPADHHRTMLGSFYGPPSGQAVCGQSSSSNQTATWHGSHVVSAIHAERAVQEKQLDMVPSSTSSNWARNIQAGRHGGANQVVPLYPSAASSGFSF